MTVDRRHVGYRTAPTTVTVDRWRVRLFCQAIGESDPVHWDTAVAQAAGHRDCPLPPTYLKAVEGEHASSAALLAILQVPVRQVLHAEQAFDHLAPVCVGDAVTVHREVTDIHDKKDGALSFIIVDTHYQVDSRPVARSRQSILVRNRLET
jgi:acyl dehydratase